MTMMVTGLYLFDQNSYVAIQDVSGTQEKWQL